jgi:dihydroflavonol-4-reductase
MEGADALMHTASPFPMAQPKDENDIIRPPSTARCAR